MFWSAIIGYIVLLAITFAAADVNKVSEGGGTVFAVFENSMGVGWVKFVLIIAVCGQLFCGMSCMTSASRMMYAFSRDGAVPGLADLEPRQREADPVQRGDRGRGARR